MALRKPARLPKSLRRPVSRETRVLARAYCHTPERARRNRRERFLRGFRRVERSAATLLREFRVWLVAGACVLVIAGICVLLFAPVLAVRTINVRRQDPRIDIEEIERTLQPLFHDRLPLISKKQVQDLLAEEYPDIERIEVAKNYPSTLTVSIYLEPVVASVIIDDAEDTLASGTGSTASGTEFSYITRGGMFVTSPLRLITTVPIETLHLTDWGIRPTNRTHLLAPEDLQAIFGARDTLRIDFGLKTTTMTLFQRAREFHIRTTAVTLWFDLQSPLSVQFQRFREFLKNSSLDQAKEYIDLRIADKVVYR